MKHSTLSVLILASISAAACVVDVNGLSTPGGSSGSDGGVTRPDSSTGSDASPSGAFACGWEDRFLALPTTGGDPVDGNDAIVRYDSAGNKSVMMRETAEINLQTVLAAGPNGNVITKGRQLVNGQWTDVLFVAYPPNFAAQLSVHPLGGDNYLFDIRDNVLYVLSFYEGASAVQLDTVDLQSGVHQTRANFAPSAGPQGAHRFLKVSHNQIVFGIPGTVYNTAIDGYLSDLNASPALTDGAGGTSLTVFGGVAGEQSGTDANAIFALLPSSPRVDANRLELWKLSNSNTRSLQPAMIGDVPGGTFSTMPSIDGFQDSAVLIASDREIWQVWPGQRQVPALRYSYTPVFGGLQGIGISDVRVEQTSSSAVATFVAPCGQTNGGEVLYGTRVLTSTNAPVTWLWDQPGFPMLPANRALVNDGTYGYRVVRQVP